MKTKERKEARRIRAEEGAPLNEICKRLKVSKSSVSLWVRDIELTIEQKNKLLLNNPAFNGQTIGAETNRRKCLEKGESGDQLDTKKPITRIGYMYLDVCYTGRKGTRGTIETQ